MSPATACVGLALLCSLGAVAEGVPATDRAGLQQELRDVESAFARTMAERDFAAFVTFLDDETVFFSGEQELRGKDAVASAWKRFFDGPAAPFSWKPETVAVLDSGGLGLTSGPVHDPQGRRIGTFNSIWRRTDAGSWKIVFDRGCPSCESSGP